MWRAAANFTPPCVKPYDCKFSAAWGLTFYNIYSGGPTEATISIA
jgi:hypothetical protein